MGQYSIKDVERLTGVKAHTIRIWEQRYGLVKPHRTDTNIRFYDDDQLKYLINISQLLKNGRKISHLCKMSQESLHAELKVLSQVFTDRSRFFDLQIDNLVIAMLELDEDRFEKIVSTCTLRYGFESTMMNVLNPFLNKVGILWATGEINVAQEHFIANLIRRKLIVAIDAQVVDKLTNRKFLLFLPEGELHEIALLFSKFLIKSRGYKIIYLGQTVPAADVIRVKEYYLPDYLLTYFTSGYNLSKTRNYIQMLSDNYPEQTILVGGPLMKHLGGTFPDNVMLLEQVEDLSVFLDSHK